MAAQEQEGHEEKARRAVRGAFFGFFVDMFDIYLPVVVLAPTIEYFVSPKLSASATSLVTGAIFAATLVGRPVGALIFGHFADRIGRKRTTIVSVTGFGLLTIVIGCMPGYATWGVARPPWRSRRSSTASRSSISSRPTSASSAWARWRGGWACTRAARRGWPRR